MISPCQCLYETASVTENGVLCCAVCNLPKLRAHPAEKLADYRELSARIGVPESKLRELRSAGVLCPVPKLSGHKTPFFHVPSVLIQLGIKTK